MSSGVHTKSSRTVSFRENNTHVALSRRTLGIKLTEWFAANEKWPTASHIKYSEFFQYFIWNVSRRIWQPLEKLKLHGVDDDRNLRKQVGKTQNFFALISILSAESTQSLQEKVRNGFVCFSLSIN